VQHDVGWAFEPIIELIGNLRSERNVVRGQVSPEAEDNVFVSNTFKGE
jgi:hypothetical protein